MGHLCLDILAMIIVTGTLIVFLSDAYCVLWRILHDGDWIARYAEHQASKWCTLRVNITGHLRSYH